LPEYKKPNRFHYSQVLHKNSSRERSVSEVTGSGGIYLKPALFRDSSRIRNPRFEMMPPSHTGHSVRLRLSAFPAAVLADYFLASV